MGVMETNMLVLPGDTSTSYQVLDTLRYHFVTRSVANEVNLHFQLYSLVPRSQLVSQYFLGTKYISDTLATIG